MYIVRTCCSQDFIDELRAATEASLPVLIKSIHEWVFACADRRRVNLMAANRLTGVHVQCRALPEFAASPSALLEYAPCAPVREEWGASSSDSDSDATDASQTSAPVAAEYDEGAITASNDIPHWAKLWKGWRLSYRATTPEAPNRAHMRESLAAKVARCRLGAVLPGRRIMRHNAEWREVRQQ